MHRLLFLVLLAFPLRLSLATEPPRPLRVVVVSPARVDPGEDGPAERPRRALGSASGPFEARSVSPAALDEEAVSWADVVVVQAVLDAGGLARLSAASARGKGLVVGAGGLESVAARLERRLGARRNGRSEEPARRPLAIQVLDQEHAITQCVTHFLHEGTLPAVEALPDAVVMARALERPGKPAATDGGGALAASSGATVPVLWRFEPPGPLEASRARVFACALDPNDGPSADLVWAILLRGIEWTGGRSASVRLEGRFELAAAALGPKDEGLLPGLAPRAGFFRGRQIAPVMSFHGAHWLLRPDRAATEEPERVLDSLEIQAGDTVADVGAGNGYFTLRLARRVGARGKVLAADIQKEMLELLEKRLADARIENVVPILAAEDDPRLPEDAVDLALLVDVYHELSRPAAVTAGIHRALRQDGRLVLIEYRGEDPLVPILPLHRTTAAQVRAELEAQGYRLLENKAFLQKQHILVFGKK